ncbi:MAG: hypothetical protein LH470_06250 [Lysobacter sp.]|nr:hypothetical protein [Lysobacter sp.]
MRNLVCFVLTISLLMTGSAHAGAKDEIKAAINKFSKAKSYHVSMRHSDKQGPATEADFAAPDRIRMKMPMGTQVIIGDTMYMQMGGKTMKVPMPKGTLTQWRDPANIAKYEATMTVKALGIELVDGKPAKKYRVSNTQPQPNTSTMWIGGNGYPLQIKVDSKVLDKVVGTTIRYSRFNDPTIRINPPK